MREQWLQIKTGNREIAGRLVESFNDPRKPFDLCGVKYLVTGFSREIGAETVASCADLRQLHTPEWRGSEDGLPPVGVECIFRTQLDLIYTVKIIAHGVDEGGKVAIGQATDDVFMGGAEMFERIQTPDELAKIAEEAGIVALEDLMRDGSCRTIAEGLYRAGVRAPELKL